MNERRNTQKDGLYVTWFGQSEQPRIVLVHGSQWQDPDKNFAHQRVLAEQFELALPHRRGYGNSTPAQRTPNFEPDISDMGVLLGEQGAHLIGESYGGWVALLTALRWPKRIKSLTLIEPIAFGLAQDTHPEVRQFVNALKAVFSAANPETPEVFAASFLSVMRGQILAPRPVSDEARHGILAMLSEARTWDVHLEVAALAQAPFPKWVVSGGWHPAFEAICDVLATQIQAQRSIIKGHGHSPQDADAGVPFNAAWHLMSHKS